MKTAKVTIDKTVFTVDLFEVENKNLTTNINLEEGSHTLTKVIIFDGSQVIKTIETNKTFVISPTFPVEIPIEFAGNQSLMMRAVAVPKTPAYIKLPKSLEPQTGHTAKFVGVLGIPDADFHFYQNDDFYRGKPITSKVKLRFAVHMIEQKADMSGLEQNEWWMYNWGDPNPIEITWNKPKEGNEIRIIFQMYYAFTNSDGEQQMVDVNSGVDGDWTIHLSGDEEPTKDASGTTHISFMPDSNWLSNADYKFYYPVYE